jgi:putative adhesin/cell wall-active antibiotic response 4TMS protein YvqF
MASNYPRHRRSIFSGLLLIIIGALLLSHNFGGSLPAWQILRQWWPLVFILWGLAKLYDHFMAQRTGEPAPPTISAGEVFLVLLLLAVIGGVGIVDWGSNHANRGDIFSSMWNESYSFTESVPAQNIATKSQVTVRTARGNITVTADDTQQISVTARKSANAESENAAQERANHVHVTVTKTDNGYVVEPQGQNDSDGTVSVELEVHVPKNISLDAKADRGGVQISGIAGNVTIQSQHGAIEVRQSGADVSVESNNSSDDIRIVGAGGNVRVSGKGAQVEISDVQGAVTLDGDYFGSLNFARLEKGIHFISNRTDLAITQLTGRVEITNPGDMAIYDSTGSVTLTATKRDLTLDNVTGKIQVDNRSGNITVRFTQPPKEAVDLTTQSGDIDVSLPAKAAFDVSARADNNGEISSDFSELQSKIDEQRGNTRLDGSVGAHGPKLDLRTTHATIRIRKGQ